MYDLAIINGKTYTRGGFRKTNVYVVRGKIAAISDEILTAKVTYDASDRLVLPGLIDPHVHFALGSKVKSVDDFYQGSVCAAYGGVTTFIDFLDPISHPREIKGAFNKRKKMASKSIVNYGFHLTVKNPKNVKDIITKMRAYNLRSIKLFTTYSESKRRTYEPEIMEILEYSSLGEFIVLAHIEKDDMIRLDESYEVKNLPESRPSEAETQEALHLADMVSKSKGKLYMVHCSSGRTLTELKKQYEEILDSTFFVESCPHYFTLSDEKYDLEEGYKYTMAPPLRSEEESRLLADQFKYIYSIGTDHCSFTLKDKQHELLKDIPMGIGGIEHSFDLMYHQFGEACIEKMSLHPALAFGLYPKRGRSALEPMPTS